MGKRHSERLARQHAKGMLNFSGTERMFARRIIERLKRRIDPPQRPQISISDARREAIRQIGKWFAHNFDDVLYKALIEGATGPINLQSSTARDVHERPPEG